MSSICLRSFPLRLKVVCISAPENTKDTKMIKENLDHVEGRFFYSK
jgi:hypothetical protein